METQQEMTAISDRPSPPLAGLRVLDLTQFLSGPYGTQMLADLGAEVIKLEPPHGDSSRHIPPHFIGEDSVYYVSINRNKQSVAIDIKTPAGLDLVRKLALASDVVVENFRPGVLDRLGLKGSELRAERPSLIWCSISGFGQDGPYRDKPAYDMIVQALSGGMSLTGEPGRPAVRAGIPIGDLAAGMYAASAILAALYRRMATGKGDTIDISMLDCQAAMLCYQGAYYLHSGQVPARQGSAHDSIPTYRGFVTADGSEIVITANTERMWQGLCRALDLAHLADDPKFKTNRERYQNRFALWPMLEKAFLKHTAAEWVPLLEAESIPVGVVNTLDRVMVDPQIQHRAMVMSLQADDGRSARVMGNPMVFAEARRTQDLYPPALGENTMDVLRHTLGLTDSELADLVSAGAIAVSRPAEEAKHAG
ncbi:CaiB/BaiF CoA transferase family protein [Rhodoligotrophos defluvii]|uniref:CaiB/BaiF CoA transferase family protein n=1 Tax=Rhodoligotrophos defluvii TaxID=2561934 RepID=UPI001961EFE5|nr:CoA transferase [Rhodoligotrophos defluvii]